MKTQTDISEIMMRSSHEFLWKLYGGKQCKRKSWNNIFFNDLDKNIAIT